MFVISLQIFSTLCVIQQICAVLLKLKEVILLRGGWLQSGSSGPHWPGKLWKEAKVKRADGARVSSHLPFSHWPQKFKSRPTGEAGLTADQTKQCGDWGTFFRLISRRRATTMTSFI